jgi:hypothetical protein
MAKQKKNSQFENFDATMRQLIAIPHDKLKAALDTEKAEKQKRKSKTSASGRAVRGKG